MNASTYQYLNSVCMEIGYSICFDYYSRRFEDKLQKSLDAPMPWIGMYIAVASAALSLAMAADIFNGIRSKKLWFPCKYFSLNSFFLTLLAVAMKLPMDFTNQMMGLHEVLARISSLLLMSIAMGNLMTSLGSMESNEILLNLAAVGILVITIAVNVFIHIFRVGQLGYDFQSVVNAYIEDIISVVFMLLSFAMLCSSALMIPTAKKHIESKYQEMHKLTSTEQTKELIVSSDRLRELVKKHWMMAQTGSPQFVMARSANCATSGIMCSLMVLVMVEAHVRATIFGEGDIKNYSSYKWSSKWILVTQWIGVGLGTIAPFCRWLSAAIFKSSNICRNGFKDEFKIESYWTQMLVDWRDGSLLLQIRHYKCRKVIHGAKRLVLTFLIGVQMVIILTGKFLLLTSASICFSVRRCSKSKSPELVNLELSRYILLLEGEPELPKKIQTDIHNEVVEMIQKGEKQRPENLIDLLNESDSNFNGLSEFNSNEVPSLHSHQEPPNSWSLAIVTLTAIAMALPNINDNHSKVEKLVSSVREGLSLVKLIEETVYAIGELESIKDAADVVWVGVELYHKWQDIDLKETAREAATNKDVLEKLSNVAEKTIMGHFRAALNQSIVQNPHNWPGKILAANSMYRTSKTILLLAHNDNNLQGEDDVFKRLSMMISDILAACLTNLPRAITIKCHRNTIKEREESVRQAAFLLGESVEILQILQRRELPNLDPDKAANLEEWRAFMEAC